MRVVVTAMLLDLRLIGEVRAMKVFTKRVTVRGNLQASYVFTDEQARNFWLKNTFPLLEKEHGELTYSTSDLPGLAVGDKCRVIGEGSEVFTILEVFNYSKDRYGFSLDSGWREEVAKCYAV